MKQVSRPMQFTLVATLVFVAAWFLVLKPKGASDVAATPVTAPVTASATAASTPGKTNSALDKTAYAAVGPAKAAAAAASADAKKTSGETAESGGTSSSATASTPPTAAEAAHAARRAAIAAAAAKSGTTTKPSTTASTASAAATATKSTTATGAAAATTPKLTHADRVILKIQKDLAARKAVVVLVWSKTGAEDKELYKLIKHKIDLRNGRVKTFFIPVNEVGRYDGLLSGLSLGQTPSTIVIAPNNEAKVLGGLTSVARIDRLTSSAILTKPTAAK